MPDPTAPGRGSWSGAASWDHTQETGPAAVPTPLAADRPDLEAPVLTDGPDADAPGHSDRSDPDALGAADRSGPDARLERARETLARAESGAAQGVPDFLPQDAQVAPATWEDLRTEGREEAQALTAPRAPRAPRAPSARSGRGGAAIGGKRVRSKPRRRGRAEDPPAEGAAAVDAEPDHEDVARQIVLRQLAMAPRSRAQLETKLRQRDCPEDVITRVLDRMTEVGLVDDEAYAAMLVRSQQATKGLAKRALAHELRKKGIDKDLADAALDEVDPEEERRTARELVDKKLRSMGGLAVEVQTRRLAGMLARKGYGSGVAYSVIRDAIADAPEHQRD
ncbi:RecX family transcriptional regulator [Arsenicicoccus bolidensis]|uniref:RecX family transcriptional regulator n=1 Tax=Arsenicicoccus bolidensis TaxID=229480 RepID=UPI000425319A